MMSLHQSLPRNIPAAFFAVLLALSPAAAQQEDPVLLSNTAVSLLNAGKPEEAVPLLERALDLDPGNAMIVTTLTESYMAMATRSLKEGNLGEASRWADYVLNVGLEEPARREKLAYTYNLIANAYSERKNYSMAASILSTALTIEPNNIVLRTNLGMACYNDTRREEALREFRSVLYDEPQNTLARNMYARILYDMGEMKQALEELNYAAMVDPNNPETAALLKKVKSEYKVEGDFSTGRYQHFTVSFDGAADSSVGSEVIAALEAAYSSVGSDLNFYPNEKIAVVIYPGRGYNEILNKHRNLGGIYDGKIRVPIKGLSKAADWERFERILTHEYAHAVVHHLTNNNCPLWLNEGIAEYASRDWERELEGVLQSAASSGAFVPLGELSSALKAYGSNRVSLAYLESFSLVRFIANTYGVHSLRSILDSLYARKPVEAAIEQTLFLNMEQLEREWRRSLGIDS